MPPIGFFSSNYSHFQCYRITGGELFDKIVELTHYTEVDASKVIRQMTEAIQCFHANNVVHRDLKVWTIVTQLVVVL